MKKIFGVAAVLALLSGGMATKASAICDTGEMIRFVQDGFAYETNYDPLTYHSTANSVLSIVGHVAYFCAPLAALDPSDPNKEYTFYITGLVSQGTQHFGPFGGTTFHETDYTGGTWAVYEGSPEDAPHDVTPMPALPSPLVPSTFNNGILILSGTFSPYGSNLGFHTSVSTNGSNINGSFIANYRAAAGSYYPAVGDGEAIFQGNWCVTLQPTGCTPATYSAHPNGKWDTPGTTAANKSTWGSIKKLYR